MCYDDVDVGGPCKLVLGSPTLSGRCVLVYYRGTAYYGLRLFSICRFVTVVGGARGLRCLAPVSYSLIGCNSGRRLVCTLVHGVFYRLLGYGSGRSGVLLVARLR